jgi:hypothetical protein
MFMRLRFNGGPWDGVEFESTYSPLAIAFRDLDMDMQKIEGKPAYLARVAARNHHQYLFEKPSPDDENVYMFRYAPGEKHELE